MARSFEELRKQIPPERRARNRRRAQELLAELRLREVRAACELTQEQLAERLNIDQPNVSRLERLISTVAYTGAVAVHGGEAAGPDAVPGGDCVLRARGAGTVELPVIAMPKLGHGDRSLEERPADPAHGRPLGVHHRPPS